MARDESQNFAPLGPRVEIIWIMRKWLPPSFLLLNKWTTTPRVKKNWGGQPFVFSTDTNFLCEFFSLSRTSTLFFCYVTLSYFLWPFGFSLKFSFNSSAHSFLIIFEISFLLNYLNLKTRNIAHCITCNTKKLAWFWEEVTSLEVNYECHNNGKAIASRCWLVSLLC